MTRLALRTVLVLLPLSLSLGALAQRPAAFRSDVAPNAASYQLPVPINALANASAIAKLTSQQKQLLSRQGFLVMPDDAVQMFYLYEEYPEYGEVAVPNFVTIDSVLHAYHLFFDFTLRTVENKHLYAAAVKLTDIGLFNSGKFHQRLQPGALRDAATSDAVFFAVAKSLISGKTANTGVHAAADSLVTQELALIQGHAGRRLSPLLGTTVHYDQFVPRGHYTRSEPLRKYFMALMWYGQIGLALEHKDEQIARRQTRMALLITRMLAGDDVMRGLWAKIYEPTVFYVGASDDLGYEEYLPIAREVYGAALPLAAMTSEAKLTEFLTKARARLPEPGIAPYYVEASAAGDLVMESGGVQKRQFRLMGQRFIPDSYMLQQLVTPLVKPAGREDRDVPMGLDVMAALGSDRALDLLTTKYKQGRFPGYLDQMSKLRAEFAAKTESDWWQNLYWGWVYTLQALLRDFGQGYPAFMRQDPWEDKELQTSLGSWSQLRHDTILYAKPSGAEAGGGEEIMPQGYVEPVPEAFARLAYLTQISYDGLKKRGLIDEGLQSAFSRFKEVLLFLKGCAEKELTRQPLSEKDYQRLWWFGGELERLQLAVVRGTESGAAAPRYWGEITSEADRNMATIADIHTSFDRALEVGVGPAYRIYVIVPRADGKLQVSKGGVFSYFEFLWPSGDRLTDEKWQRLLKDGKQPAQQDWTKSFILGPSFPQDK
jgi:hypothetical protein